MNRREFCTLSCAVMAQMKAAQAFGIGTSGARVSGESLLTLDMPVRHPFYVWPRTLLSCPVGEETARMLDRAALECVETREQIPFQISRAWSPERNGPEPTVLFAADYKSGERRSYRIVQGVQPEQKQDGRVTVERGEGKITVGTGRIRVRIPDSQPVTGTAPGPIVEVSRGGAWTGQSHLSIEGHRVARIETEELEAGPLRSRHRVTYSTSSGLRYVATVECVAGMDFVRLHEDMESIPAGVNGVFDFAWSGCRFTHRQGPNHPYNFPRQPLAGYNSYPWEKIAPQQMDTQFGVSSGIDANGKIPFTLRLFEPWSDALAASFANFWGDDSGDAAALFIDHLEEWNDHLYTIWHSSERMAVEFAYLQDVLHFKWKIMRGTRSSCLSFYDHTEDVEAMKRLVLRMKGVQSENGPYRAGLYSTSHALEEQNWYGTLDLNRVKGWALRDTGEAMQRKQLFHTAPFKNAAEFYSSIVRSEFFTELALSGVRQNHGFGPTSSRPILEVWVPGYDVYRHELTQKQREQVDAVFLTLSYVHAGEDYMPMRHMLAGHPNFLSDVKSVPGGFAFLYPNHPAAEEWADTFEAYLRANTHYHTRPPVKAWEARGGRWTENLGTYVWAFLRPASKAAFLLKERDGYQRLCNPQLAMLGEWLVNALSAPFAGESPATIKRMDEEMRQNGGAKRHYWGIVRSEDGPRRLHPPQGAHSERRKTPRTMWYLGQALKNYDPLVGEHVLWAARPTDQDMEATMDDGDPYEVMFAGEENHGTDPHLKTSKFTGYGIVLRTAVGTPRELSLHLMQIDDGPNYRWGIAGEGGCGSIYFYANGKGYSHNGGEDVGDRIDQDTDFSTSFGVWKNGVFRSIGQNVLSEPVYDLSVAQFARLVPRQGEHAYAWPEYVSRDLLLAGDDYFLLFDQVFNPQIAHRFSWFVRKGDDFPHIAILTGESHDESSRLTSVETETTSGRWVEGTGNSLVLVTHKEGIHARRAQHGAVVTHEGGRDLVFLSKADLQVAQEGFEFAGTAGLIRERKDATELALFHGTRIAGAGLSLATTNGDLGIALSVAKNGNARGRYEAGTESEILIGLPAHLEGAVLYADGVKVAAGNGRTLRCNLPAGTHACEITGGLPVPIAPSIERTESIHGGAIVVAKTVASATAYELQISADNAQTWTKAAAGTEASQKVEGLHPGAKYHVRMIARNAEQESEPGAEYPVYATNEPPSAPDGLHVELEGSSAEINWGQVLGVTGYRLYRRAAGEQQYRAVYTGLETRWVDRECQCSGTEGQKLPQFTEYYVTSLNHIGEGKPSRTGDTNPASWRTWKPNGNEPFRRMIEASTEGLPNDGRGLYYPSY
jgi:hypothetical protein